VSGVGVLATGPPGTDNADGMEAKGINCWASALFGWRVIMASRTVSCAACLTGISVISTWQAPSKQLAYPDSDQDEKG
jgi:hypothetical protein